MSITVEVRNVYGNQTIYPVCETAKKFADLARQKTLTSREIRLIKELGYEIQVKQQAVAL